VSNDAFPLSSLPAIVCDERSREREVTVQRAESGAEYRIARSDPRYRYQFSGHVRVSERTTLETFFDTHGGMRESFLLTDPVDGVSRRVRFDDPALAFDRVTNAVFAVDFELVTVGA
jgi:phage-related protein